MREIFPELLLDPTDLDMWPGKDVYRILDNPETPVVRDLLAKSNMADLLAFAQYTGQQVDNGDFVSEFISGLPGTRSEITKGEVEIKTEQNLGIFDSIGTEVECGAVNLAYSMYETMVLNWNAESRPSPRRVLKDNDFTAFLEGASLEVKRQFLKEQCDIRIVGISAQLEMEKKAKLLMAFKQYAESPMFGPYIKRRELLNETAGALGMYKAPFLKTDDELKREGIDQTIAQALVNVAKQSPEAQQMISNFLGSIGIDPNQFFAQMGAGGGNGGGGQAIPAPGGPNI